MTIDSTYPAVRNLQTFPVWSDERRNAQRMLTEYEECWDDLSELAFGAPEAYPLLRDQADRLSRITQHCGSIHGWTVAQYSRLRSEAHRLLAQPHEFRGANWTEP